jgi:hypothetical protein
MHICNTYFNIFLLSFCKFCHNLRCIGKLDDGIHVNINQMKTFKIITLILTILGIASISTIVKSLLNDGRELGKIKLNHTQRF